MKFVVDRHGELREASSQFVGDLPSLFSAGLVVQPEVAAVDPDVPGVAQW
ncbi:hypothetical protein AB0F85_14290 [Nocardia fluminea]